MKNQNIVIEQKLLRSQMTPHFIFNSLSILQGMILNKEETNSINYLSKFSKLLRITLENSRYKTISLSAELIAIESYFALQNFDSSSPFLFQLIVDPKIKTNICMIPPMLIQPFIENAIVHAFVDQQKNREIVVRIRYIQSKLICTISDNGVGINTDEIKRNSSNQSLATAITEERLTLLSKESKVKCKLKVENRKIYGEQGTLVTLDIPFVINSN